MGMFKVSCKCMCFPPVPVSIVILLLDVSAKHHLVKQVEIIAVNFIQVKLSHAAEFDSHLVVRFPAL